MTRDSLGRARIFGDWKVGTESPVWRAGRILVVSEARPTARGESTEHDDQQVPGLCGRDGTLFAELRGFAVAPARETKAAVALRAGRVSSVPAR